MSNSVDPNETAHHDLDQRCMQKPVIVACGSERVYNVKNKDVL